ncbi:MAG: sigma 54-interacting transcriptional regulator [Burkholderiales bacterium]|nr:sigma 54-interacting transcriptional regulator [Burkholderiales bacterium]
MNPPKTLIAWLSVQDCRSIKDYPATQGGVVLSALNSGGATRLVLLSQLQPQFTNEYLEKLSEVWPGDISLRLVDQGVSSSIADLWPWASAQLKAELDAHPEVTHDLLLASSLPSCQAIFLTHGLTDERCRLLEPLKNGDFQSLSLPRIQLEATPPGKAESVHGSNGGDRVVNAAEEVDFYDLGFEDSPAEAQSTDADVHAAQSDAGPGLLAVLVSVEETCDEVATEDEFGVSNAGPVVWFDETSEAEETAAAQSAEEVRAAQALHLAASAEMISEPEPELESAHEWAVEEVALKSAEEIDFPELEAEAATEAVMSDATFEAGEPELESAHEWAVEEVALKSVEEIDFSAVESDLEADAAAQAMQAISSFEEIEPVDPLELSFEDDLTGTQSLDAACEPLLESAAFPEAESLLEDAPFAASELSSELDFQPESEPSIEDELSKAAAALDDPFDDFATAGANTEEPQPQTNSASDFDLDFPSTVSDDEEVPRALEAALAQEDLPGLPELELENEPEPLAVPVPPVAMAAPWPYASAALQQLAKRADALAGGDLPVLVLGEAGSGTRLLAKRIHELGLRANAPMIVADLTAIHPDAIAQELWGEDASVRGERRAGFVELAQGGSLLIAGLELVPAAVQTQLLSLMTRGDYLSVGAENPTPANVRILATASDELLLETKAGRFNRKLFDLFGKGLLTIPALRNRKDDLPALLDAIWQFIQSEESHQRTLSVDARDWLLFHGFSGTVKDLELALRRTCLWAQADEVDVDTLRESVALSSIPQAVAHCGQAIADGFSLKDVVFSVTKHFIHQALTQSKYDLDKAAALLGVSDRDALAGWMKRVGIEMPNENNFEDTHAEHHDFESAYVSVQAQTTVPDLEPNTFDPDLEISLS